MDTEYLNRVHDEINNTIAIDFDGVIHKSSKGVYDGTIYDEPVDYVKYALETLSKRYNLVIFSCRARPDRPLVDGKDGIQLIWEWLNKYELAKYISNVTHIKPRAIYYIDDKGITFNDWISVLMFIGESK